MRETDPAVAAALTSSHTVSCRLSAYYNGVPVVDAIPVREGSLGIDGAQAVPGVLRVTVPRFVDTDTDRIDMLPTSPGSPLSCEGVQVVPSYTIGGTGQHASKTTIDLGWYRVESWEEEDDGLIGVTAVSLEALIAEARFIATVGVAAGTTFPAAAAQLLDGLLPLQVTADAARTASGQTFEDDRLAALSELVASWPARMFVDDSGTLVIAPPYDDDTDPVVLTLTDGEDGTVVRAPTGGSREGVHNAVKASGEASGEVEPVSAVSYITFGPRRWNGPYGNVPYFYSSPLLTTVQQCRAAARTRLASLQALAAPVTIDAAPDPRIERGDVIELVQRGVGRRLRVDAVTLPLTAAGGAMGIRAHEIEVAS